MPSQLLNGIPTAMFLTPFFSLFRPPASPDNQAYSPLIRIAKERGFFTQFQKVCANASSAGKLPPQLAIERDQTACIPVSLCQYGKSPAADTRSLNRR